MARTYLVPEGGLAGRLIGEAGGAWDAYTRHPFVEGLKTGELPRAAFEAYLVQDYLFLLHFSRAWALAAFKAEDLDEVRACAATVHALANEEVQLHVRYCAGFGLSEQDMRAAPEHPANAAYTRYVMAEGAAGDLLDLLVALSPCVVGYGEIAAQIVNDSQAKLEGNPYKEWIETYAGDEYRGVALAACEQLDRVAAKRLGSDPTSSPRWPVLVNKFAAACRLEADFWQMGLDLGREGRQA